MALTPEAFQKKLEELVQGPISLKLNTNLSQVISVRYPADGSPPRVSVHRAFLEADDRVVAALAQYIRHPTTQCRCTLRQFIDSLPDHHPQARARRITLRSRGRCYDLNRILGELNEQFFQGSLQVAITWGRNGTPQRRRRRHIQLGSYYRSQRLIRIHPLLDSPRIPEFFVRFVVYHEMLHALLDPPHDTSGRRRLHGPEFRRLERRFPQYAEAMAFERKLFETL